MLVGVWFGLGIWGRFGFVFGRSGRGPQKIRRPVFRVYLFCRFFTATLAYRLIGGPKRLGVQIWIGPHEDGTLRAENVSLKNVWKTEQKHCEQLNKQMVRNWSNMSKSKTAAKRRGIFHGHWMFHRIYSLQNIFSIYYNRCVLHYYLLFFDIFWYPPTRLRAWRVWVFLRSGVGFFEIGHGGGARIHASAIARPLLGPTGSDIFRSYTTWFRWFLSKTAQDAPRRIQDAAKTLQEQLRAKDASKTWFRWIWETKNGTNLAPQSHPEATLCLNNPEATNTYFSNRVWWCFKIRGSILGRHNQTKIDWKIVSKITCANLIALGANIGHKIPPRRPKIREPPKCHPGGLPGRAQDTPRTTLEPRADEVPHFWVRGPMGYPIFGGLLDPCWCQLRDIFRWQVTAGCWNNIQRFWVRRLLTQAVPPRELQK